MRRVERDEIAKILGALAFAGLVTAIASATGGLNSFAATWLILVPAEAALSRSRRVIASASLAALGAAVFLWLFGAQASSPQGLTPAEGQAMVPAILAIVAALLYAMGLALGAARGDPPLDAAELAGNMADLVTRHARNGDVVFASSAAAPILGVKPHDLHGRGLFDRVHVMDRPAYLTALRDAASLRQERIIEFRVRRDPPTPGAGVGFVWVEMRCWPLIRSPAGETGEDGEVIAVFRDITARKDEEHAIEDARAEAERANVAKTHFIATMSHELRTPLNAIIGFSEMLREEDTLMIDAKRRHDYAHLINESGHHLLSVVNGLLDMSRIESGNFELMPEPVEVEKVITECCELLALRARQAGIEIVIDQGADLPRIIADKRALLQIMLNLLSNAIKFTNRGGKVTVAARVEVAPDMTLEGEVDIAHVIIAVEDTGVGIGAQDLERVGEPFFQARSSHDRRHDGTGLGMSIVKRLLALHGGRMKIESDVGKGTRILVHLPIDCEAARGGRESLLARTASGAPDARSDAAPAGSPAPRGETVAREMVRKRA